MTERFKLSGLELDLPGLEAEVDRRAGSAPDEPPSRRERIPERAAQPETPGSAVLTLLRSLAEDADVTRGFPPQSHRPLAGAVVAAKRGFRKAFQPVINEALGRQRVFNRRLLDTVAALYAENQQLEARIRTLEARVESADKTS